MGFVIENFLVFKELVYECVSCYWSCVWVYVVDLFGVVFVSVFEYV